MRNVEPTIFRIAESGSNWEQMRDWLDHIGADTYEIDLDISDAESIIGHAAKRCYMSFEPGLNPNVNKVRKDWFKYFENIMNSGHGSVLEHATFTYAIEGVSRVFTAELNRHRAGVAISEGSMRYIRFDNIPFWMPTSLRLTAKEEEAMSNWSNSDKEVIKMANAKSEAQDIFEDTFRYCEAQYKRLCDVFGIEEMSDFSQKKILTSMFRRIIPMGVASGGVWTFNMRALRHIIALRTTPHAEEEISLVMSLIAKDIVQSQPKLMCDFEETPNGWVPKNAKV